MIGGRNVRIARETWILAAIGLVDLFATITFIRNGDAQEANPLFQRYWNMGVLPFILAKVTLMGAPLCILEWARRRRPRLVTLALRGTIVAYLTFYGIGLFQLNGPAAQAREIGYPRGANGTDSRFIWDRAFYPGRPPFPGFLDRARVQRMGWQHNRGDRFGALRSWTAVDGASVDRSRR